ncbi:hypothetical protein HBI37_121180 [Parastagonospora nodorum]|nr:hypothetical protein HBI37_121180 [Parastagonospora nodorum]
MQGMVVSWSCRSSDYLRLYIGSSSTIANPASSRPYSILASMIQLKRHAPHPLIAPNGLSSTNCTLPSSCSTTSKLKPYLSNIS